jgi:hypothetical protein
MYVCMYVCLCICIAAVLARARAQALLADVGAPQYKAYEGLICMHVYMYAHIYEKVNKRTNATFGQLGPPVRTIQPCVIYFHVLSWQRLVWEEAV